MFGAFIRLFRGFSGFREFRVFKVSGSTAQGVATPGLDYSFLACRFWLVA